MPRPKLREGFAVQRGDPVLEPAGGGRRRCERGSDRESGRSLAADVRFDDPTVSRRHALIVRQADGVRVLDDRSLNGVFVNGERVEWRALSDGDEIVVGRYRMTFVTIAPKVHPVQPLETAVRSRHTQTLS